MYLFTIYCSTDVLKFCFMTPIVAKSQDDWNSTKLVMISHSKQVMIIISDQK